MEQLSVEAQGFLWDATAHGPDEWAYECEDGNTAPDALEAEWPTHRTVFCNPPFSAMRQWVERIVEHPGPTVTVCKLAPSTRWWQTLTSTDSSFVSGDGVTWWTTEKGRITRVGYRDGVSLWLLPVRVAYEAAAGVIESAPSFDSCVVWRRGHE